MKRITIEEFQNSGALWFVNNILHLFGLTLIVSIDENGNKELYPSTCEFRGFDPDSNDRGYLRLTKYLEENIDKLVHDVEE